MAKFPNNTVLVLLFLMLSNLLAFHQCRDVPMKANKNGSRVHSDVCIQLPCPTESAVCWCCRSTRNCFIYGENKKTCETTCPI